MSNHVLSKMKAELFPHPLILIPPQSRNLRFCVKILSKYQMDCCEIWKNKLVI